MLAIRRLRSARGTLLRRNTTSTTTISASDTSLPQPTPKTSQGRVSRKRRPISLDTPKEWKRPIAYGVLPAYDEALRYIMRNSSDLKSEAENLRATIQKEEHSRLSDENSLMKKRKTLSILEVQSEINIPEVRWKVANGMVDMEKPVHRHILEQRWREEGALDLLMERLHQMHVVPDVIGTLRPSLDLRVVVPGVAHVGDATYDAGSIYVKPVSVEPGVYVLPQQTRDAPRIHPVVFHPETRLYTLIMVDPDVPDEINQTYQTYVHWLKPNIPLSALSSNKRILDTDTHTRYLPPHPQRGTNYHRYTTLLLQQPSATEEISVPALSERERYGFDIRGFMMHYGLDGTKAGAHMFREVWSEEVSNIHKDILGVEEPKFGRPKKMDPYAGRGKRYVL